MDRQRIKKGIKEGSIMIFIGIALICIIYFLSEFTSGGLNLFLIKHFRPLFWARLVSVILVIFEFLIKITGVMLASAGVTQIILNVKRFFELR